MRISGRDYRAVRPAHTALAQQRSSDGQRAGRSAPVTLRRPDGEHGAVRPAHDALRDGAHERVLDAGPSVRAEDEQVDRAGLREGDDLGSGLADRLLDR